MFVPIFLEIDDQGNPIYKDEFSLFYKEAELHEGYVIVSSEYESCVENFDYNIGMVIPKELMSHADEKTCSKGKRAEFLAILRDKGLEEWFGDVISKNNNIMGFITWGQYYVVNEAASRHSILVCLSNNVFDKQKSLVNRIITRYEHIEEKLKKVENKNRELKETLNSKDDYIQQLQARMNNIEREIYRNKEKEKSSREEVLEMEERLERTEKDKYLYLDMYKELLVELDRTKTELLNIKSKQ